MPNPLNPKIAFAYRQGRLAVETSMFFTVNDCPYSVPEYAVAWCLGLQAGYGEKLPDKLQMASIVASGGFDPLFDGMARMCAKHSRKARTYLILMNQAGMEL